MLLRLAYLTVTDTFAVLRPLPMSDRDKDAEILALRHQITLSQHQLGPSIVTFTSAGWAFLAALSQPCRAWFCAGDDWSYDRTPGCAGTTT